MNVETLERLETASKEVEAAVNRYLDELYETIAHEEDDEFREHQEADAKHALDSIVALRVAVKELGADPSGIYARVRIPELQRCFAHYAKLRSTVKELIPVEHQIEAEIALSECYDGVAEILLPKLGRYGTGENPTATGEKQG